LMSGLIAMKIQTECVPCLLKRIIFESEQITDDKELQVKTLQNACNMLAKLYNPNSCSACVATQVHRVAYDTLGTNDPYHELKRQSNEIALKLVPLIEEKIKDSNDALKTSMLCSIIGNMMDFGIDGASRHPKVINETFEKEYKNGIGHDDYNNLTELLEKAKNVVLFTDNCGEIVFDKILCRELKKKYPDIFLTLVVKGKDILSDATMDDAVELGFDEVVDNIHTTGCFAVGVDFTKLPKPVEEELEKSDIIICKGMANYEAFSETKYHPIAYLMRTKCNAIASSIGVKKDMNIIKLYP